VFGRAAKGPNSAVGLHSFAGTPEEVRGQGNRQEHEQ
jgi:hypothetical protein